MIDVTPPGLGVLVIEHAALLEPIDFLPREGKEADRRFGRSHASQVTGLLVVPISRDH